jgi:hypothetical protein
MREQLVKLSRGHDLAKAFNYILKRWASFTLFLEDGRVCLSNNAAERGLRGIALGRKSWLFCGSDRGGRCPVQLDRHSKDELHRPASVAYGYPRPHRRPSAVRHIAQLYVIEAMVRGSSPDIRLAARNQPQQGHS